MAWTGFLGRGGKSGKDFAQAGGNGVKRAF
jgi:hypothetical protein